MRPEANLQRRGDGSSPGFSSSLASPASLVAPRHRWKGESTNHITHHQPQELIVRENGAGPRIRTLVELLVECRVSANNPLFPRFVRSAVGPRDRSLLELLCEKLIDEATAKDVIRRAKAMGDAIDARREEREARLRKAGFEEVDDGQQKANLARNVALLRWPQR